MCHYPSGQGGFARLSARFFKVNDMIFLDTTADEPQQDIDLWWMFHISHAYGVPHYTENKTLRIIPLNALWLNRCCQE